MGWSRVWSREGNGWVVVGLASGIRFEAGLDQVMITIRSEQMTIMLQISALNSNKVHCTSTMWVLQDVDKRQ